MPSRAVYPLLFRVTGGLIVLLLAAVAALPAEDAGVCIPRQDAGGQEYFNLPVINEYPLEPEDPPPGAPLAFSVPAYHSNPGASKKLYLDFDGNTYSSGSYWGTAVTPPYSIDSDPGFSSTELTRIHNIWKRVAEDFAPFDIDVTTEVPSSFGNKIAQRICIGGSWSDWYGSSAGGVAYIGSFRFGSDVPGYVFEENLGNGAEKYTAEAISHEAGHTLGLYHQSRYSGTSKTEEYHTGGGSGATAWAPIMGNSYYNSLSVWYNGHPSYSSSLFQEDISVIASTANGIVLRSDDVADTLIGAVALTASGTSVSGSGIIGSLTDVDMFSFSAGAGSASITVSPYTPGGNLDVLAELYDGGGSLLQSSDPDSAVNATLSGTLSAGTYYVAVRSRGDYGRLGQYSISGTIVQPSSDTTAPSASLTAANVTSTGSTHSFTVTYSDDVAVLASSIDGSDIRVTGPSSFSELASLVSVSPSGNGTPRSATYRINAPGGGWDPGDNGTYTVSLIASQVRDTSDNYAAAGSLGTFTVSLSDSTAPGATLQSAASVSAAGATSYSFVVRYTDNTALQTSSIDNSDVRVTGPAGYNQAAQYVSIDSSANGTPRLVTYRITPPGGSWDPNDNGSYTIALQSGQVRDTAGNAAAASTLGGFTVAITTYAIAGSIETDGGTPLVGVEINGGALGTRSSGTGGTFSFGSHAAGTAVTLTPTFAGYDFTPAAYSTTLTGAVDVVFTGTLRKYHYFGVVSREGTPLAGISVVANGITKHTDAEGRYTVTDVPHGTVLSITLAGSCYQTLEGQHLIVAGTGSTERNFTVTGCAAGCAESGQACAVDSDGDGLSDELEEQLGTDSTRQDSDGDQVMDGREVRDHTDPMDRGSYREWPYNESAGTYRLVGEYNSFLTYNIAEYQNPSTSQMVSVNHMFRDLDGTVLDSLPFNLDGRRKLDVLLHEHNGYVTESYGLIEAEATGPLLGGVVFYQRPLHWSGHPSEFSFAFMIPFQDGMSGEQAVGTNTFPPGLSAASSNNMAANWISVVSLSSESEQGTLTFYDSAGAVRCPRPLRLTPGQRIDTPAHGPIPGDPELCAGLGRFQVGHAVWRPQSPNAKFLVRNVRYVYNNPHGIHDFSTAFQLAAHIPRTEELRVPLDTRSGTAVLELLNASDLHNTITVKIYDWLGGKLRDLTVSLGPRRTEHLIMDEILVRALGSATIKGSVPNATLAVAMEYGRQPDGDVRWMYGVDADRPYVAADGGSRQLLTGAYNTFLGSGCMLFLTNSSNAAVEALVSITRSDGTPLLSAQPLEIAENGTVDFNCGLDETDRYGSVTADVPAGSVTALIVRTGMNDRYRFPTKMFE